MDPRSQDPATRLRALTNFAGSIKLESRIPIQRHVQSSFRLNFYVMLLMHNYTGIFVREQKC
jgi:hypothetical protein